MKQAKTLMIQGTASNVGKSVITAAICRMFVRRGYKVAPFKAQNMSNNSYVTASGGEIGRAQAVQAQACGIEPDTLMNPILLKPGSDMKAQVVVRGKPTTQISSIGHPDYQKTFQPVVHEALDELRSQYDLVVIEGAGSPAEMNLKERDLVNMNLALYAKSPVILVGDIDWGGIFAQLVGTYELLEEEERDLIKGFLINKFRGDQKILDPGIDWIKERTQVPTLGVLPFVSDIDIAEEDSIDASQMDQSIAGLRANVGMDALSGNKRDVRNLALSQQKLLVDIIWMPRISNFTDFDLLKKRPDITLRYLHLPDRHTVPDLIILPGTKSTISDLDYLRRSGLSDYILRAHKNGAAVMGICGGYQMLGRLISDADAVESDLKEAPGLGLIPMTTAYHPEKITRQVQAHCLTHNMRVEGYEIHMGQSGHDEPLTPLFSINEEKGLNRDEGVMIPARGGAGEIYGTYLHGLFAQNDFVESFLNGIKKRIGLSVLRDEQTCVSQEGLDRVTDLFERHIDFNQLAAIAGLQQ